MSATKLTVSDLTEDLPRGTTCLDAPERVLRGLLALDSCGATCVVAYRVGDLTVHVTIREGVEPLVTAPSCPLGPDAAMALGSFLVAASQRLGGGGSRGRQ